jgi:hypothetical protein
LCPLPTTEASTIANLGRVPRAATIRRRFGCRSSAGTRTTDASIIDTAASQFASSEERLWQPSASILAPSGGQDALDKPSILPDTAPMIRFPAALHFWFFGYPTIVAAGGTRVI